MNRSNILFAIILCILTSSCGSQSKLDEFYTDHGGLDYVRIPLIKPYELTHIDGDQKHGWLMELKHQFIDITVTNIRKCSIKDGVIMLHSINTLLDGQPVKESWHVIIPGKGIEMGFANHKLYVEYLQKAGMINEPTLHNIDSIADYYVDHDSIDWENIK